MFFLILMRRIICISFYNIDWYIIFSIRLHFYYIYILHIYNRNYPNSIRIVVDDRYEGRMVGIMNYQTLASRALHSW